MANDTRIPQAEVTGMLGAALPRLARRRLRDVPEALEARWHDRKVLKTNLGIVHKAQRWDDCDENQRSFALMAAASRVGCSMCLDLGDLQAYNEGLDVDKACEVPRCRGSEPSTPLGRDVVEYVEAMSRSVPTVSHELSARLLEQVCAPALVDLTTDIALANLVGQVDTATGVSPQGSSDPCGLPPLTTPSSDLRSSA